MDFLAFAAHCGPGVHPLTTQAIVRAESGFDPLVIRNNTLGQTFRPRSRQQAQALAAHFHRQGHRLALGLMQVTTPWFARYAITPESLLDGCTNIRYGTAILAANYAAFLPRAASPQQALAMALSAYWSGQPHNGGAYVNQVYRLAGSTVRVPVTRGITDGLLGGP
jgi:type IV secretion system protein VirB1